jgi:hypothetical protein
MFRGSTFGWLGLGLLALACDPPGIGDPKDDTAPMVDADGDGWGEDEDCDDGDPTVHPGAAELCNDLDDDCDGLVDGQDPDLQDGLTWYADRDGDGYGDPDATDEACHPPPGHIADASDCDDDDATIHPEEDEVCDGVDNDCDSLIDDEDDSVTGRAMWYADNDGDGYGDPEDHLPACEQPSGRVDNLRDCDDTNPAVHADAEEICDGVDNDCDGLIDDEDDSVTERSTWYTDADGDGFGDPATGAEACEAPDGSLTDASDCDDGDAAVNPDAGEICDGIDNDCDGLVDDDDPDITGRAMWYADDDGDGYGDPDDHSPACDQPGGYVSDASDCDDSDASINPDGAEVCNGHDDDCDGLVDDDDPEVSGRDMWYADHDGDGWGIPDDYTPACDQPSGYASDDSDCDDSDASIHPGASEICNDLDDDCDDLVDDDDPDVTGRTMWYADADGDGYGDASDHTPACDQPSGYVSDARDCDDSDATVTTSCASSEDDGSVCSALMGIDDGLVPSWAGVCDTSLGYVAFDGHCYYAVATSTGWDDARASCIAAGGYLAVVTSSAENSVVMAMNDRPYLGGCDADVEGTWTWVTGESWSWDNWAAREPNNQGSREHVLEMYATSSGGPWNDITTTSPWNEGYVCEFESVTSSSTTDTGDPGDTGDTGLSCALGDALCPGASCADILADDPGAASGSYWIDPDGDGSGVEVSCEMSLDGGGWTVLADWDFASDSCPGAWVQHTSEGLCYGNLSSGGQLSATIDAMALSWSEVLVDACMRQYRTDDAFQRASSTTYTLEGDYVDGMSLTHGSAGARQHLFTWAIGSRLTTSAYSCPDAGGSSPPSFVGSDWDCDSGNKSGSPTSIWYTDRLFEGDQQHLTLSSSSSDDLEARIIFDQPHADEDIGVCGLWIAIR